VHVEATTQSSDIGMKSLRVASLSLIAAAGVGGFIYLKQSGLSVEALVQV
jgi:hypothetical protein